MSFLDISKIQYLSGSLKSSIILDMPKRHVMHEAPWYSRWMFAAEIHELDDIFFRKIQGIFKRKLGVMNDSHFQRIWSQALASYKIEWTKDKPLTAEQFSQIQYALQNSLVYLGEGMSVETSDSCSEVGQIVRYLLGKGPFDNGWINEKNVRGVLWEQDPELLQEMRKEFRYVLNACCRHFPEEGSKEELIYQAFIGNIIALIPYSYPEEGEEFIIPQKVDGKWKSCNYVVDRKIPLMEQYFSSPLIHYGLTSKEGPPLLTFLGTTFPAGDGFIASLFSSCIPGLSVGHAPYFLGKDNIGRWLEGKRGVRLFGISLGGALAFHTLRDHKEKIDRVDVYSPAGLYFWNWQTTYDQSPAVHIYCQDRDVVPSIGSFPYGKGVFIYHLIPDEPENFLKAHFRVYSGKDTIMILRSSPEYENSKLSRALMTGLHLISGVFPFIPLLCAHLLYLLFAFLSRPVLQLLGPEISVRDDLNSRS